MKSKKMIENTWNSSIEIEMFVFGLIALVRKENRMEREKPQK